VIGAVERELLLTEADRDTRIHVVEVLEATAGGTRTHLLHLLGGLDPKRFRVSLIASRRRNPDFSRDIAALRAAGVRTIDIPMGRRIAPWRDAIALAKLVAALRELQPDVVHTHASKAGILGRAAAWLCGIRRVVHTPHVYYFEGKAGLSRRVFQLVERIAQPLASKVVLLSPAQRALASAELGAPARRTVVAPNGVDTVHFSPRGRRAEARRRFGLPPDAVVIGAISRFRPQKACDFLLRALAEVFAEIPDARCLLIGDGPLRDDLMALGGRLGVRDHVVWKDFVSDPRDAYEAMDVFAMSSVYEGMPYTILEAMSMSLPVVATRIPGCAALVRHGVTGLLAEPGDPAELARALVQVLRDPKRGRAMGAAGRRRVEDRYTLDRFIARMQALYETEARRGIEVPTPAAKSRASWYH